MKKFIFAFVLLCASTVSGEIVPCFTPGAPCTDMIVKELNLAKKTVLVQAYSFTSRPIAEGLINAAGRGATVAVVFDKGQEGAKSSSYHVLKAAPGIKSYIDAKHAIAHNKIIVIDGKTLITGSFNFTASAQLRNAENLLIIKNNPALIEKYLENFKVHLTHSVLKN